MRVLEGNNIFSKKLSVKRAICLITNDTLFEFDISDQVFPSFDALRKEHVAGTGNGHYMGVFAEGLESDGIMNFARRFARIVQLDKI
jgi:hypothetical protein